MNNNGTRDKRNDINSNRYYTIGGKIKDNHNNGNSKTKNDFSYVLRSKRKKKE